MTTLTVTAKGQITLKQELLRHLNVAPGQKIEADKLPDGRLIVRAAAPKGTIADFSGCLAKKGTPKLTIAQIKKITEDAWAGKR
jgi:antitoxin PrlF